MNDKKVLNLIMLGTWEHQEKIQTVLTEFYEQIEVGPLQSKHLINGLGASPGKADSNALMVGTYTFTVNYDSSTGELQVKRLPAKHHFFAKYRAMITGWGYREAIDESLAVIDAMLKSSTVSNLPLTINMLGFSRGADTLLRVCNVLQRWYGKDQINVNMFAIDPVAGFGRRHPEKARLVPDSIAEYEIVLMENEKRFGFNPQDKTRLTVQDPHHTEVHFHLYKGNHFHAQRFEEDPTSNRTNLRAQMLDANRLLWDDIQKFGYKNGVRFKNGSLPYLIYVRDDQGKKAYVKKAIRTTLTDDERLDAYTSMLKNDAVYKKLFDDKGKDRSFLNRKTDYFLHGTNFFQDKYHMLLFKKKYPHFFDYTFQANTDVSTKQNVINDIQSMSSDLKTVLQNKLQLPNIDDWQISHMPPPQGIQATTAIYEDKNLMGLWEGVQAVSHAVIVGYDHSVSKKFAEKFREDVMQIMTSNAQHKLKLINQVLLNIIRTSDENGAFNRKLRQIVHYYDRINMTVDKVIDAVESYKNKLRAKKFTLRIGHRLSLITLLISGLMSLKNNYCGNSAYLLSHMLNACLHAEGRLSCDGTVNAKENGFHRLLRQLIIELANYAHGKNDATLNKIYLVPFQEQLERFIQSVITKPVASLRR